MNRITLTPENMRRSLDGIKTQTRRVKRGDKCPYKLGPAMLTSSWAAMWWHDTLRPSELHDHPMPDGIYLAGRDNANLRGNYGKSRPAMFAPLSLSHLFPAATITAIREEPLQMITEEDAIHEGCLAASSINRFRELWDSININRAPWASNPTVWVLTYEVQS